MLIVTIALGVSIPIVAVVGYLIGHKAGGSDKMDELHALQEEGWLTIEYSGDSKKPDSILPESMMTNLEPGDLPEQNSLRDLMLNEKVRPRRDTPERRGDWATAIKNDRTDELEEEEEEDEEEEDVLDFKAPEV
jgi:hypothetical protein